MTANRDGFLETDCVDVIRIGRYDLAVDDDGLGIGRNGRKTGAGEQKSGQPGSRRDEDPQVCSC